MKSHYHDYVVVYSKDKEGVNREVLDSSFYTYAEAVIAMDTIFQMREDIELIDIVYNIYEYDDDTEQETCLDFEIVDEMTREEFLARNKSASEGQA